MRLFTPDNLHYPIKVTKLLCKPGDDVARNQTLFNYTYTSKVFESSAENPEGLEVERTWPARFESELEGQLNELTVAAGQVITRRTQVADIEEPCKHEVQFGGICAICGTDVTTLSSYNSTIRDTDRATVNTVHGHTALLISHSEASRADEEAKRRLLDTRKLSLVVDLDQTIIHATVDPTVAEWQQDPSNPNHAAVKDVRAFHLVDDVPGARGCWYYIKLRPGLAEFLDTISRYYELHIYTMGTRAYAENIAKIIDPNRKIFADRILSRDESGSLTAKTLKRLFPVDTRMVVIIDDRGDVWQWSPNLIKVTVYDFFVGIGDINSSFLPKRQELEVKPATQSNGNNTSANAVDQLVSMAGNQDAESMKEKSEEQDSALASQLADRPLLQKQKILDAADDEAKISPAADAAVELLANEHTDSFEHPKYRQNLLQDDDTELLHLSSSLQRIHNGFFEEYDSTFPMQNKKSRDLQTIPDAAQVMRTLKARVLSGVHLVFSGVVPLGVDIFAHDTVIWAQTFGAHVTENITKRTTHIVASPERRTAKVRQAARKGGRIKIVSVGWLMACFSQWRKVSETPFRIHSDAERKDEFGGGLPDSFGDDDKMALSSSDDAELVTEDETEDISTPATNRDIEGPQAEEEKLDDELARYGPTMQREDSSPTETEQVEDWGDIDAELAEFLGSDAEMDSDTESLHNVANIQISGKRKREDGEEEAAADVSESEGSRLQKRKKEALSRTSSLIAVAAVSNGGNEVAQHDTGGSPSDEDENDDLEAALAAELLGDDD